MNSFNNHFCNFVLLRVSQRDNYLFLIRVKREDFVQGTETEKQTSCSQYEIKVFFFLHCSQRRYHFSGSEQEMLEFKFSHLSW